MVGMCGYVYSEYLKSNMDRFIVDIYDNNPELLKI